MRQIKINETLAIEIVTTQEVKDFARIDTSADDTLIGFMITQARIWCENYISRDIVAKNRTYYLPKTSGVFDIPFGPIASIESITIDGAAYSDYDILGLDNETISLDGGEAEEVKVTYITEGLNDPLLKQAILQLVATYYDNRADFLEGSVNEIPSSTRNILSSYKTMFL